MNHEHCIPVLATMNANAGINNFLLKKRKKESFSWLAAALYHIHFSYRRNGRLDADTGLS
jgi:hypothetical protein